MATDPGIDPVAHTAADPAVDTEPGKDSDADVTTEPAAATVAASARVRPGFVTAAVAAVGLALGGLAGYGVVRHSARPQIILRQAGDSIATFGGQSIVTANSADSSEVSVALRNDSSVAVQIIGATLAGRTAIIGPLAPTVNVPPKDTANVYIGFPESNGCDEAVSNASFPIHPVEIVVFVRTEHSATQQVTVEITGFPAVLLDACEL